MMHFRTVETSVQATVLSPRFSYLNLIVLIKSFFLVPHRFRFSICRGLPPEKSVNPTLIEPVDLDVLGSWRFYGVVDHIRKAMLA